MMENGSKNAVQLKAGKKLGNKLCDFRVPDINTIRRDETKLKEKRRKRRKKEGKLCWIRKPEEIHMCGAHKRASLSTHGMNYLFIEPLVVF